MIISVIGVGVGGVVEGGGGEKKEVVGRAVVRSDVEDTRWEMPPPGNSLTHPGRGRELMH